MTADDVLARSFEDQRARLIAIAYQMLGSRTDAEDAVQEAWLRAARQDADTIDNLPAWLTTVVARISLDMLRSRKAKPQTEYDEQLPDFVVTDDDDATPEEQAVLADSVGLALLVVLETLNPDERLSFVLHDVFGLPFAEIAQIIGKSVDAAKMLASRARRKIRGRPHPTGAERRQQREVVDAFLSAAHDGDFERLLEVLDPDLTWSTYQPNGAVVKLGTTEVLEAVERGRRGAVTARRVLVNGEPGILTWGRGGKPISLMACTVQGGRIVDVVALLDPARLATMDLPAP